MKFAGTKWEQVSATAFPERAYHSILNLKGRLYVMDGQTFKEYLNDVWKSCDEGANWSNLGNASWPVRAGPAATIYNDEIVVAGGCYNDLNGGWLGPPKRLFRSDVSSSPDGVSWIQVTPKAEWSVLSGPRLVEFQEKLFLVAGARGFTADVQLQDILAEWGWR